MSFDLVLLRRFEAVCRLRSFSRAADELGLSHSAMTKSIRSLEENLNVRLIERTTRSVAPTPAGQRLLNRAPDLLAHSEDVIDAISADAAQLNIICGPVILDAICHRALLEFRVDRPEVHVALQVMAPALAFEQLIRQRVDLLLFHQNVVRDLEHRKSMIVRTIISEPYVVLFRRGHPIQGADASIGAMLRHDWVVAGFDKLFQEGLPRDQREMLLHRGFPKYRIASLSACADMAEFERFADGGPKIGRRVVDGKPQTGERALARKGKVQRMRRHDCRRSRINSHKRFHRRRRADCAATGQIQSGSSMTSAGRAMPGFGEPPPGGAVAYE